MTITQTIAVFGLACVPILSTVVYLLTKQTEQARVKIPIRVDKETSRNHKR